MSEKDPKDTKAAAPKADERNLVQKELDAELPPEERIKVWWERNRVALALGAIVALVIVVGFQGIRLQREAFDRKVQEAWLEIADAEERLAFAERYGSHPLGGIAWLKIGDAAYAESNFEEAQIAYEKANTALVEPVFQGRARIGAAISSLKNGDRERARLALEQLAGDPEMFDALRAEAAFHRAILAAEDKDVETFERYRQMLMSLQYTQGWINRLESVEAQLGL